MAATAVSSFSSPKARLLKFLAEQSRPVSAKEVAVYLDSRTSSASEFLERCAAQGLCARGENDRPRMYLLSEAGRERLRLLGVQPARTSSEENNSSAGGGGEEDTVEQTAGDMDRSATGKILTEVRALREDVQDLTEIVTAGRRSVPVVPQNTQRVEPRPEEAEELTRRADALAREAREDGSRTLREMFLREVDALRQFISAAQPSGVLEVILQKPKFRGLGRAKRERLEGRTFGAAAIANRLREISQSLGGAEELPAMAAGDFPADTEAARSRLLTQVRSVQQMFEHARRAHPIPELAANAEKLSEFFAGLAQRLETAAVAALREENSALKREIAAEKQKRAKGRTRE